MGQKAFVKGVASIDEDRENGGFIVTFDVSVTDQYLTNSPKCWNMPTILVLDDLHPTSPDIHEMLRSAVIAEAWFLDSIVVDEVAMPTFQSFTV
jgi:hypothetical protein